MKLYCLIGHNIEDSLSPAMFQAAFKEEKIEAEYKLFDLNPNDPEKLAHFCYESELNGIVGFSVTMPYKEVIMDYLDYYDPLAKKLGSVNTVKWENSNLNGYNTDATGALQALREKTDPKGKKALILGSGGAARAIIYSLKEFGAQVYAWGRNSEKTNHIAELLEVSSIDFPEIRKSSFDIIINATPVGRKPHIEQSLLTAEHIAKGTVVMDIVTHPLETQLIKEAKKAGAKVITGERMLLHQAAGQFEIWFEKPAPFEVMEKALYSKLQIKD